ncbi:16317_t:CDS:2, partial [Cetraspora pellucida]
FIGTALKGEHGQFFTPRNVVRFVINFLDVEENKKIIDPACGTGGFIVESLPRKNIFGCDRDSFLSQACKAYMCILEKKYNIILTNPPFGQKIMVEEEKILKNLLEKNGKLAIVLPEASIFGNKIYRELRKILLQNYKIIAVFSLPPETFKPFTGVKPAILVLENSQVSDNDRVICVNIQNVGHDKRGKILYKYDKNGAPQKDKDGNFVVNDELGSITAKLKSHHKIVHYQEATEKDKVFFITHEDIKQTEDLILIPSYYNGFLNKQETK